MYRGFKLDLDSISTMNDDRNVYRKTAKMLLEEESYNKEIYENYENIILNHLRALEDEKYPMDALEIIAEWFPEIDADVFLSHSHRDKELAMDLAKWLYDNFGLKTFIDSLIWGYEYNLLKIIYDEYSSNPKFCDLEEVDMFTSHVHMMLSNALLKMIDKSECVFFLNTPSSMPIKNKTLSPWIYTEIGMTQVIEKKSPKEHREKISLTEAIKERLEIVYPLDLSHLADITKDNLEEWKRRCNKNNKRGTECLDYLYKIVPLENRRDIL